MSGCLWRGRPLEELSKEELIEALELLGDLYQTSLEQHIKALSSLRSLRRP